MLSLCCGGVVVCGIGESASSAHELARGECFTPKLFLPLVGFFFWFFFAVSELFVWFYRLGRRVVSSAL